MSPAATILMDLDQLVKDALSHESDNLGDKHAYTITSIAQQAKRLITEQLALMKHGERREIPRFELGKMNKEEVKTR